MIVDLAQVLSIPDNGKEVVCLCVRAWVCRAMLDGAADGERFGGDGEAVESELGSYNNLNSLIWQRHFLGMASLRNLCSLLPVLLYRLPIFI